MKLRTALQGAGSLTGMVLVLAFFAALIIVPPFLTLWAINTVAGTAITMTFWRWLALVWLGIYFSGTVRSND